jgi:hypothetical protein
MALPVVPDSEVGAKPGRAEDGGASRARPGAGQIADGGPVPDLPWNRERELGRDRARDRDVRNPAPLL